MQRCPICRALLNGAETCRRCRAELGKVEEIERLGQALLGVALHRLALGDTAAAAGLLRRAHAVHSTQETKTLLKIVGDPFPPDPRGGDAS
jgi:hypothetical protein